MRQFTSPIHFTLTSDSVFEGRPDRREVAFDPTRTATDRGRMMLLHEVAHALLGHDRLDDEQVYNTERAAWVLARALGKVLGVPPQERLVARSLAQLRQLGHEPSAPESNR